MRLHPIDMTLPDLRPVVLGKARSEGDGRFRVERRDVKDAGSRKGALVLWAHRPGAGASWVVLKRDSSSPEPSEPVRLTLAPTSEVAVRVLDPQGVPVAGAAVAVILLQGGQSLLPDELAGRLGSTTDAAGRAVLKAAPPEDIFMLRVTTGEYGAQSFIHRRGLKPGTDLRLRPVARVEGHVSSADPASARGLHVHLSTSPRDPSEVDIYGKAEVVTDARGRFAVPALAAGALRVDVPTPEGSLLRALNPAVTAIEEKGRAEIEIPLKRLVTVRGVVREKGTTKPVADVTVGFTSRDAANGNTIPLTRTDAEGRFEALALPSPRAGLYVDPPPAFLRTMRSTEVNVGEADGQAFPIEVERGATLRGRVVDEAGAPVPGAIVEGKWQQSGGSGGPGGMSLMMTPKVKATTEARGDFLLEGIHPGATVSLEARSGDARTEGPRTGQPGAADPVTLRLSTANTVALSGRVVDPSGRPVPGALLRIRSRSAERDGLADPDFVRFEGSAEIRTGPDGRFRTPRQLRRGYGYSAEVQAEGRLSDTTSWLLLEPSTEPTLPDLALLGLRTVRGRVLDDRGRPVAGAVVRVTGDAPTPVRVVSDAQGRFTLAGVLETPAFLFVEKPGYRFQWRRFGSETEGVDINLNPEDGPPPEPMATLPPALPRAEELALLHRMLDPYAESALKQGAKQIRFTVLPILIRVEPARVLELIDREGFADPQTRDGLRAELAKSLIREQPDDALAQIEAIENPSARTYAAYEAAGNLPGGDRARVHDLLGRALVAARAIVEPTERAAYLALIGERYFDLGEARRATVLLREAEAIARELPVTGRGAFARGTVAEELSPIDLPAALELLKGTEEGREYDRHLGCIAHELAGRDPAASERVLMRMRDVWPNFRDKYAQRVCHRMASVDPGRARRLADAMKDHKLKARAYGVMALALAPTDRPAATRLLAEAFGLLARAVEYDQDHWDGLGTASTAAAGLLPIVEQVDPRLVREYLGRTLALRPPLRGTDTREGIADLSNAQVAAMVARYDRESARAVLDAYAGMAVARLKGMADRDQSFEAESVFTAAALVDPARAVALAEGLPDASEASDASPRASKATARLAVARVLAAEGPQRWREVEWSLLHLWRIDSELY